MNDEDTILMIMNITAENRTEAARFITHRPLKVKRVMLKSQRRRRSSSSFSLRRFGICDLNHCGLLLSTLLLLGGCCRLQSPQFMLVSSLKAATSPTHHLSLPVTTASKRPTTRSTLFQHHRLLFSISRGGGGGGNSTTMMNDTHNHNNEEEEAGDVIGGGSINEKKRVYYGISMAPKKDDGEVVLTKSSKEDSSSPSFQESSRAHLMHAIEGLHRYPHYLARWSMEDCHELESALEETLSKVRQQKLQVQNQRQTINQVVAQATLDSSEEGDDEDWKEFIQTPQTWDEVRDKILDPKASKAIFRSNTFRHNSTNTIPTVNEVLNKQATVELDVGYLEQLMEEECYDCYSFPIFKPSFCSQLQRYIRWMTTQIENAKNCENYDFTSKRGMTDLDNLGLKWLNDLIFHLLIQPISRHLYQQTEDMNGKDLDWRQGYIAAYSHDPTSTKPRQRLVPHTDDSEVTLNICLGDVFEGGNLVLWGLRNGSPTEQYIYEPQIGRAVIHSGRQFHEVSEITSGDRFAYILWARSWAGTRATTCPCCWLNNRRSLQLGQDSNCICGRRWN